MWYTWLISTHVARTNLYPVGVVAAGMVLMSVAIFACLYSMRRSQIRYLSINPPPYTTANTTQHHTHTANWLWRYSEGLPTEMADEPCGSSRPTKDGGQQAADAREQRRRRWMKPRSRKGRSTRPGTLGMRFPGERSHTTPREREVKPLTGGSTGNIQPQGRIGPCRSSTKASYKLQGNRRENC